MDTQQAIATLSYVSVKLFSFVGTPPRISRLLPQRSWHRLGGWRAPALAGREV